MDARTPVIALLMLAAAAAGQRAAVMKLIETYTQRIETLESQFAALNQHVEDVVGHSESGFVHSDYSSRSQSVEIVECPDGWTDQGGSCWRALTVPRGSFEDQKTACRDLDEGAFIAIPQSAAETQILLNLTTSSTNWIGVVKAGQAETDFVDVLGRALVWENWADGKPDNLYGDEDCVEVYSTGFWNDVPCTRRYEAVCQIQKDGFETIIIDRQIAFKRSFTAPPNIILSVTAMDAYNGANLRYDVKAFDVTADGFRMRMMTWEDSHIFQAQVEWLAVPDLH